MDEPLTMERGGETYYYHRDALGSITEVTNDTGDLVERYEYNVYGAVTIFDGAGITLTASAIGNPYLFTARRYVLRCAHRLAGQSSRRSSRRCADAGRH
jgi:hypothetical protein